MFNQLNQGGLIAWLIVAAGAVALAVFLERALHLHRARIMWDDFLKGVINILRRNNITEALAICDDTPGPVAIITRTAILRRTEKRSVICEAVENVGDAEIARMERRLAVIATVAHVAPLLGLLGTVYSMMGAMLVMRQQAPLVQSVDLAEWLMKALGLTALGLLVAIFSYAAYNLLVVKIERIVLDMRAAASEIIAFLMGTSAGECAKEEQTK